MSLASLMTRQVTILRADIVTNRYGNAELSWGSPTEIESPGWLAQLSSSEQASPGRDAEVTSWRLHLPAGTDITADDRVTVDDVTYEVDGPPNRAWRPAGEHHIEVNLRLVDG